MNVIRRMILILGVLALTLPSTAPAQDATSEQIEELLGVMNAGDMAIQVMYALIDQFEVMVPDVPASFWEDFMAKVDASTLDALIAPIYQRNFTAEEVVAMSEFYRTPVGQSMLAKMPVVMQESMAVGQEWGMQIAEELVAELQAEGYEVPGANEF